MQERLSRVEKRLQDLDDKVEERLYDTRPIWEKLVTDVAQLQDGHSDMLQLVGVLLPTILRLKSSTSCVSNI